MSRPAVVAEGNRGTKSANTYSPRPAELLVPRDLHGDGVGGGVLGCDGGAGAPDFAGADGGADGANIVYLTVCLDLQGTSPLLAFT